MISQLLIYLNLSSSIFKGVYLDSKCNGTMPAKVFQGVEFTMEKEFDNDS